MHKKLVLYNRINVLITEIENWKKKFFELTKELLEFL